MNDAASEVEALRGLGCPIRVVRRAKGLSLRDAAELIGCHHQALYMNEQGCYPHVLPVILDWLVENSDYTAFSLDLAYQEFIRLKREDTKERFDWSSISFMHLGKPGSNPLTSLHESLGMSRAAFCKNLCLSSSLLYTLENSGASHVAAVIPPDVTDLLLYMGISSDVIEEMHERYGDWYLNEVA